MVSGTAAQNKSLCSGSRILIGYWRRRRSRNSATSARNMELRISMNIPATPSRNSGLADRNITEDHHRFKNGAKTNDRTRAGESIAQRSSELAAQSLDHGPTDALRSSMQPIDLSRSV